MDGRATPAAFDGGREVETAVMAVVAEHARQWFPELTSEPALAVRELSSRPRSRLLLVEVDDGSHRVEVVAKVRRSDTKAGPGEFAGQRPRLAASALSEDELTSLEYEGLSAMHRATSSTGSPFTAVRPLAHLRSLDTILMDYVPGRSLRRVLAGLSRPRATLPARRPGAGDDTWRGVGGILRTFQDAMKTDTRPSRQASRQEVVAQFERYDEFLTDRLGSRRAGEVARRGAELAAEALPAELPLAVGHGDFAPRNILVTTDEQLLLIDPLPRWAVPEYEDLCRFLVGVRLSGSQVYTHGAALGRSTVERVERAVLEGFYPSAENQPSAVEVRCYQLLLVLDRWSALLDQSGSGSGVAARRVGVELASGFLRGQGSSLLDAAGRAARSGPL